MHAVLAWLKGHAADAHLPATAYERAVLFTMKKQPGSECKCAGVCNEEEPLVLAWRMTEKYNYLIKDMSGEMYAS